MKRLWVHRDIDASASAVWAILIDHEQWADWGPTVRGAQIDEPGFGEGTRGCVMPVVGPKVPFEVTDFEDGTRWAWKVAGLPATDHTVHPIDSTRCRAGIGVPWPAAPYLAVCTLALERIGRIAESNRIAT